VTAAASPQELVLRGYASAVQAITDAELHNDPNWPGLFETMINPELGHVQGFITTEKQLGYHSSGTARIIRSELTSFSPTKSEVQACLYGAVIAYQANGQPVPGNAGQPTYDAVRAVLIPAGRTSWVVQNAAVQQFPTPQEGGRLCSDG
jgi:hypothetical protein